MHAYELLKDVVDAAEADLRWRLAELFQEVKQEDEQKYIDLSGMQGFLTTTEEKLGLEKAEVSQSAHVDDPGQYDFDRKEPNQRWAKSLYRRAVKRCHPDTVKVGDEEYKLELTKIYKDITEAYSKDKLDALMVESYKIFVKPKLIIPDQLQILDTSSKKYKNELKLLHQTKGYTWSTLSEEEKELFLINFMKQQGIRFVDKSQVKEVLNRKPKGRKVGERPKNNLRERVKGRK
jgi:hypothetical protein